MGFPGGTDGKNPAVSAGEMWVRSLDWEHPLEEGMAPTPAFLPENPMDRGAWRATVHGDAKSRTR